jgi:hypothetical protein
MELLSGHEKIITKSGISLNAGTLNWGFTVLLIQMHSLVIPAAVTTYTHFKLAATKTHT